MQEKTQNLANRKDFLEELSPKLRPEGTEANQVKRQCRGRDSICKDPEEKTFWNLLFLLLFDFPRGGLAREITIIEHT